MRWVLLLLSLALGACTVEGGPKGELALTVQGLPQGAEADITLEGPTTLQAKGSGVFTLPAGTYAVKAKDVLLDGVRYYAEQVTSPVEVKPRQRAEARVVYREDEGTRQATLALAIGGLPPGAQAAVRLRGQGKDIAVRESSVLKLPPGTYLLEASPVDYGGRRYLPDPERETLLLPPGESVSKTVTYRAENPPGFAFSLSPQSLSLPQGQRATLVATLVPERDFQGLVTFSLVRPPAGFNISGGPVNLTGPIDEPLTLSVDADVPPGSYSLVVKAEGGGVVRTQTLSVQVTATTGQLAVSIVFNEAPPGTEGYVVLSGPQGDQVLTRSQVLTLPVGTYTLTAYSVRKDGVTYNPSPPGGTVQVNPGQTTSFTITYAKAQ